MPADANIKRAVCGVAVGSGTSVAVSTCGVRTGGTATLDWVGVDAGVAVLPDFVGADVSSGVIPERLTELAAVFDTGVCDAPWLKLNAPPHPRAANISADNMKTVCALLFTDRVTAR